MLEEIRKGNPDADITFLISTGCHRGTTVDELKEKFGEEIVQKEKIIIHDCDDTSMLVSLGTLPSGGELIINRLAVEADLLVAEGFIEPHFFAGFFAAQTAKLAFLCNVVINSEKQPIFAVSGDVELAHARGCEFLCSQCMVKRVPSDIVITTNGGYPLDQNIYQAVKGMTAAEATVKEGGVTIMLAKSNDGHGGKSFHETFKNQKNLSQMMADFLATPPEQTIIDQWQSQIFARLLMHSTVIYISDAPDEIVRDLHMLPAHSIAEAVTMADEILVKKGILNGKILAIFDGVSVIVR